MGWWRNDEGDQLGDEPADAVQRQLGQLAERRGARPTLEELLLHLAEVVEHKAQDLCAPGEDLPFIELVAEVEAPSGGAVTVRPGGRFDPRIRDALDALCEAISDAYAAQLERRPTRRELLRTFDFVLGHAPDHYLDLEPGSSVRELHTR